MKKSLIFLFFLIFSFNFLSGQSIHISVSGELTSNDTIVSSEQRDFLNLMATPFQERPTNQKIKLLIGQEYFDFIATHWSSETTVSGYIDNPNEAIHYSLKKINRKIVYE